jgi:hypothetical protein
MAPVTSPFLKGSRQQFLSICLFCLVSYHQESFDAGGWRLACFDFEKNTIRSMGERNVANLNDETRSNDTSGARIDMML